MNYKDRMHPLVSKAELEVFKELSRRGLTTGMVTNDYEHPIILERDEKGRTKKATIPDFWWIYKRTVIYLDGEQVHRKRQEHDEEIQNMLEVRGWQVLRISYDAPLTRALRLEEMMKQIEEFLGEL